MALIIKDRVKEITTTTGTGAVSLGGSSATFDAFQSVMSNGDTTFYAIVHTASGTDEWEVGLGTWNTGNTLTRTTVYAGSNGTSAVNFSSGNKDIFMTYPASKAVVAGEDVTFADITATDITSTGTVTLSADPSSALQAATKQYVDTIAAAGIHYHAPVRVEHPSNLNATYNNGSSGVGATLTNAGTNAALVLDNVSMVLNDRVLVANQTDQTQNGVYTVTTVGDGSTAWVLTRSTDTDSYAPSDGDSLGEGDAFFIKEGDTNAGHLDVMSTSGTITFGTTNIVFSEVAETSIYSAGTGLTLTGTTFSTNQDISTSASPTFNNITVTGTVDGRDVATDGSKLDGIEAGATADQTASEIKTAYESNSNTNAFTDAEKTKLSGIETGATGDQTASEILTAIKTVDGAASGLDADLLDGQQGSYYLNTGTTFSGDVSGTYNNIVVANDSHTHDGRYYTETEADSRFVNVTGDTMTGNLIVDNDTGIEVIYGTETTNVYYTGYGMDSQRGATYIRPVGGDNTQTLYIGGAASANDWNSIELKTGSNTAVNINGNSVFHDGYHPNADKWTTARTLSLSGDASGSVSWDGSANVTLSVAVSDDSHSHSQVYIPDTRGAARAPSYYPDRYTSFDFQNYADTGAGGDTWHVLQTVSPWSTYNNAHRQQQIAFTGTGGLKFRYATSDSAWASWQTLWTSGNDGSGSGLDADLLDGIQASSFLRSDTSDTFTSGTLTFGGGTTVDLSTNDVYLNARVIHNASGGVDDGLFLGYANANSGITRLYGSGSTSPAVTVYSNYATATSSFRAPIFYDSNNTSYYTDPASTSSTNLIRSNQIYDNGGSRGLVLGNFAISNTDQWPLVTWAYGTGYDEGLIHGSSSRGVFGRAHFGIHFDDDRSFAFHTSSWDTEMEICGDGRIYQKGPVTIGTGTNHSSAPALYVYQGNRSAEPYTGIYVKNPDTTGAAYTGVAIDAVAQSHLRFLTNGSLKWQFRTGTTTSGALKAYSWDGAADVLTLTSGGSLTATGDMRSTVFYDSNDTNYYVNPNSSSDAAVRVRGGALFGPNTTWSAYLMVGGDGRQNYTNDGNVASVVATDGNLHLDAASGHATYINYYDGGTLYFGSGSNTIVASVSNAGVGSFASLTDYNNTAYYADLAGTSKVNALLVGNQTTHNVGATYGLQVHHNNRYLVGLRYSGQGGNYPWLVHDSYDSTSALILHYNGLGDRFYFTQTGHGTASGSFRAPIFYDSNDTGFYVNPNSDSRMARLNISDGNSYIIIGDEQAGYNTTYAQIRTTTSGALRIDSRQGQDLYLNWYNNSSNSIWTESVIRAPIYYDRSNSSYYVDPASTTVLNNLTVNGTVTGISASATGGGSDNIFWENDQTVTTNYTITNGQNAMSAGPITINSGVTVTIGTGEAWTVV